MTYLLMISSSRQRQAASLGQAAADCAIADCCAAGRVAVMQGP